MKIYTRRGDTGQTTLAHGVQIAKSDDRLAALGDVDEFNCQIGLIRTLDSGDLDGSFYAIQNALFEVGAVIADPSRILPAGLFDRMILDLESQIDKMTEATDPLRNFILPGGSPQAAQIHLARAICRRAERSVIKCRVSEGDFAEIIRLLNRLSDWLFTAARWQNQEVGVSDVIWKPQS